MGKDSIVPIVIAILSLLTALSAQRQSAKTSKGSNQTAIETTTIESKSQAETEAYSRAKAFYTDIIDRQDSELIESRAEVGIVKTELTAVKAELEDLKDVNERLVARVIELEKQVPDHQ